MTPATRSLLAHAAPAARWGTSIVLFVLVLGMLPTGLTASVAPPAPAAGTVPAHLQPAVQPAVGCSGTNGSENFNVAITPPNGPAPLATQFNLTTYNLPTPYDYSITFGDGHSVSGTVTAACVWGSPVTTLVNHTYTWPAIFSTWTTISGANGTGPFFGYGTGVYAYGPAGYYPFNITTNVTTGTVPTAIHYNATVGAGVPTGLTYVWNLEAGNGDVGLDTSSFAPLSGNVTARNPGFVVGDLRAVYPNGTTYDDEATPAVWVAPVLNVTIGLAVTEGSSPFVATFWGNTTNASDGGVPTVPYTLQWNFGDYSSSTGQNTATGSPVHHTYWDNNTVYWGVSITAQAVDGVGDVLGQAQNFTWLYNGSVGAAPPLRVNLTPWYPGTGSAPFTLNATVSASGGYAPYGLQMCVFNGTSSPPPIPSGCAPIWVDIQGYNSSTISNWNGTPVQTQVNFTTPGQYVVAAYVNDPNSSTPFAVAWIPVNVTPAPAPLTLAISASPLNGTAPLNVSFVTSASGGTAPYILQIWVQNLTPVEDTNVSNWSGASLTTIIDLNGSGNWSVTDAVQDATGQLVFGQNFTIHVAPAPAAPLVVTAAFVPLTSAGSFQFSASVTGGVAPYTLVWNFGDGSSQPGALSGTVAHTYEALGTYFPSLTVTDHAGRQVTRQLGALVVTTGPAPGVGPASAAPWGIALVVVALIGSALVIGAVVRWATHRREGLNWVRPFEEPSDGRTRPPSAP